MTTTASAWVGWECPGSGFSARSRSTPRTGGPATLTATKPRVLLVVLLLHAKRPVSISTLVDALWPLKPPPTASGALRTHASTLRTSLRLTGLTARSPGYQLDIAPDELDMLLFQRLAREGHQAAARGDLSRAADLWERALGLWRGRPLDGVDAGAAAESTLADLAEQRLTLLERRAQARLALGRHAETLPALAAATAEQLHELTMLALYRAGRQAEALETFQRLRRRLVVELGIEPGAPLQRLQRQILSADPALAGPLPAGPIALPGAPAAAYGRRDVHRPVPGGGHRPRPPCHGVPAAPVAGGCDRRTGRRGQARFPIVTLKRAGYSSTTLPGCPFRECPACRRQCLGRHRHDLSGACYGGFSGTATRDLNSMTGVYPFELTRFCRISQMSRGGNCRPVAVTLTEAMPT